MAELKWEKATEVYGRVEAEMLKSFLEAEGVPVELIQEGAGESLFPTTVGMTARVEVFVPKDKLEQARSLIVAFNDPENQVMEGDEDNPAESIDDEDA